MDLSLRGREHWLTGRINGGVTASRRPPTLVIKFKREEEWFRVLENPELPTEWQEKFAATHPVEIVTYSDTWTGAAYGYVAHVVRDVSEQDVRALMATLGCLEAFEAANNWSPP